MGNSDSDAQIGRKVSAARGARSQQSVADGMRRRGHRWSQATVWSVEKGDRPLRLSEAADLAVVLDVRLAALAPGHELTEEDREALATIDAIGDLSDKIYEFAVRIGLHRRGLAELLQEDDEDLSPEVRATAERILDETKPLTLAAEVAVIVNQAVPAGTLGSRGRGGEQAGDADGERPEAP